MSAPAESFLSIVGNVITKSRINLRPTTTKMLVLVKNKVTKIGLYAIDSVIADTNIVDEPDICAKTTREINDGFDLCAEITRFIDDNSDEIIMDNEDKDRDCNYFGD